MGINNSDIMNCMIGGETGTVVVGGLAVLYLGVTWREGRLGLGGCIPKREEGLMG